MLVAGTNEQVNDDKGTDFSFAMRSKLERSRASAILLTMYCPARYVAPTAPAAIASPLRFLRSQRRVADIIMSGESNAFQGYRGGVASMLMRRLSHGCAGKIIFVSWANEGR
jgi:hypothetical protein